MTSKISRGGPTGTPTRLPRWGPRRPRSDSLRVWGPIAPRRSRICYARSISNARPSFFLAGAPRHARIRSLAGARRPAPLANRLPDLDFKREAIICQLDTLGQARARRGVRQIVAHVREEGALRRQTLHHVERFVHGQMGRMRTVPQRVQDDGLHAVEQRPGTFGDGAAVSEVGERSEPIAENLTIAVQQR